MAQMLYETEYYSVVLMEQEKQKEFINYGIQNKLTGCVEGVCSAMFTAIDIAEECQKKLAEHLKKERKAPTITLVH